jgi:hypothetical protein
MVSVQCAVFPARLVVLAHVSFPAESESSSPETNLASNPVRLGLLQLVDFERLLKIYFERLHPFFWLLLPELHTPDYISNSPFLTTAVAFVVSSFDPLSAHLRAPLERHVKELASDILATGQQSLEIVQAFFILRCVTFFILFSLKVRFSTTT